MRGAPFAVAALICLFLAGPAAAQYDPLPAGMRADAPAGDASVTARPVLKVALLSYSPPWYDASFTDETIRFLAWKMPQYRFEVTWLEAENFSQGRSRHRGRTHGPSAASDRGPLPRPRDARLKRRRHQ